MPKRHCCRLIIHFAHHAGLGYGNSLTNLTDFHAVTDCVCPQEVVTYECTVYGSPESLTVWEGTALRGCNSGEIIIYHTDFETPKARGSCTLNSGEIAWKDLRMQNGSYTSQLNITFSSILQGNTVNCSLDNGTNHQLVGHDSLHKSAGIIINMFCLIVLH